VAIVACRPAPTTTEPAPPPNGTAPGGIRSFHDDPIVIDNGPVRIDLGSKAKPSNSDKKWSRDVHELDYMAILVRKQNGTIDYETHVAPLCPGDCKIILGLVGDGEPTEFTFEVKAGTGGGHGELVMSDQDEKRKFRGNGRWLKPRDPGDTKYDDLRIQSIAVYELKMENGEKKEEERFKRDFTTGGANYEVDIVIIAKE
jgi:hypothetical protein